MRTSVRTTVAQIFCLIGVVVALSCAVSSPSSESSENSARSPDPGPDSGSAVGAGPRIDSGSAPSTDTASAFTSDGVRPFIYWLDVGGKVLRSDALAFSVETLVADAGDGPDGIAVDVPAGHVYWTNMGVPAENDGSIWRANLDGTDIAVVVDAGQTFTPKQLELVPEQHKLYWSDREGMRVMRSNLEGTEIETLYQAGLSEADRRDNTRWCVGIAVDIVGGYFYWSQKGGDNTSEGSVRRAKLVGLEGDSPATRTDVEVLFEGEAATCDIDLDLDSGFIYWANRGDDTINRAPIPGTGTTLEQARARRETVVRRVDQAIGVFVDKPGQWVYYTDAVGDLGRSRFDGGEAEWLIRGAGAFTGIAVVDLGP